MKPNGTASTSTSSCTTQIVNLGENTGLQNVINTISAGQQTSTPRLSFCGLYFLTYKAVIPILPLTKRKLL